MIKHFLSAGAGLTIPGHVSRAYLRLESGE